MRTSQRHSRPRPDGGAASPVNPHVARHLRLRRGNQVMRAHSIPRTAMLWVVKGMRSAGGVVMATLATLITALLDKIQSTISASTVKTSFTLKGNLLPVFLLLAMVLPALAPWFGNPDGAAAPLLSNELREGHADGPPSPYILKVQNAPFLANFCISCPILEAGATGAVNYVRLTWSSMAVIAASLAALSALFLIVDIALDGATATESPRYSTRDKITAAIRAGVIAVIISTPSLFDDVQTFLMNPLIGWPISMGRAILVDMLPPSGLFSNSLAQCRAAPLGSLFAAFTANLPSLKCIAYANENGTWWPLFAAMKMMGSWGNLLTLNFPALIAGVIFFFAGLRAAAQAPAHMIYLLVGGFITITVFPIAMALSIHPSYRMVMHRQFSAMAQIGWYAFFLTGCILLSIIIMNSLLASLGISSSVQQLLNDLDSWFMYNSGKAAMNMFDPRFWGLMLALGSIGTLPSLAAQAATKVADTMVPSPVKS